ncbi:hypothetical protein HHK36_014920 [Tetracentron sinense]|uniref:Uncharacterized protein n=1 Tax=Tetracentron sinense TaxID=13715 RepID=A0A834YZU8_TETSI|nr:hypothetical protein HHK36_014920 [Tetracentron sinense]
MEVDPPSNLADLKIIIGLCDLFQIARGGQSVILVGSRVIIFGGDYDMEGGRNHVGSGYESEDSSANEVDVDSSGLLTNDDEDGTGNERQHLNDSRLSGKRNAETVEAQSNIMAKEDSVPADFAGLILKCKSVFKCRLCPRIVCLTEDTLRLHLKSKKHARSEKLLNEGRLKLMLNSDGEIKEDQETHAERHARTVALAQDLANPKKNKARQRQKLRLRRKKIGDGSNKGKAKQSMKNPAKKRRRNED